MQHRGVWPSSPGRLGDTQPARPRNAGYAALLRLRHQPTSPIPSKPVHQAMEPRAVGTAAFAIVQTIRRDQPLEGSTTLASSENGSPPTMPTRRVM